MDQLKQEPNCQYELNCTPKLWYTGRSAQPNYLSLPQYEAKETDMVFDFQKCDPALVSNDPECATAPVDFTMKFMIDIKALDGQDFIVARDDSLQFDVRVESPCPGDEVVLGAPIADFVYFLEPAATPVRKDPAAVQKFPQCLRSCELNEATKAGYPNMFDFNSFTGEVVVSASIKSLHGKVYDLALTCTSLENGRQATNRFRVSFQDACLTSPFIWPAFDTVDVDLYATSERAIPLATTEVANCDPIYYKVRAVAPDTGFTGTVPAVEVSSNGGRPLLTVRPYERSNVGGFTVSLEACAVLQSGQENCDVSSSLRLVVHDPCLKATILASDLTTVMTQPILGYQELNLAEELGVQWPWTNTVDYDTPDSVGTDLCGPLVYQIVNSYGVKSDMVRVSADLSTLIYEPTLAHSPGGRTVDLKLTARLANYPTVAAGEDSFRVFLQHCQAEIDSSAAVPRFVD